MPSNFFVEKNSHRLNIRFQAGKVEVTNNTDHIIHVLIVETDPFPFMGVEPKEPGARFVNHHRASIGEEVPRKISALFHFVTHGFNKVMVAPIDKKTYELLAMF